MAILNLHKWVPISRANGPGDRFVLWFQGCSLKCSECFNPLTHSTDPHILMSHEEVFAMIEATAHRIEGITISGGEPMEQPGGLLHLLEDIRRKTSLSTVLYSGYTQEEITTLINGPEVLGHVDILVAGRFNRNLATRNSLYGSSNQEICFLSPRYTPADLVNWYDAELIIDARGEITMSGVQLPVLTNEGSWNIL